MTGLRCSLLFCILVLSNLLFGQQANNRFSADIHFGSTKPFTALTDSFFTNYIGLFHADAGLRYMPLDNFGVKLDFGFDHLKNDSYGVYSYSKKFSSNYSRVSIQGVVNIGKLLHYADFAANFGLIGHGGLGYSMNFGDSSLTSNGTQIHDNMFHFILGLSPQIRLHDRFALHLDLSIVSNLGQKYNFDFKDQNRSKYGMIANVSVGGAYYIGKNKKHVDWSNKQLEKEKIDSIPHPHIDSNLVVDLDRDKDFVLDTADICPDEPGLAEFNGCPQPEITFDCNLKQFPIFTFQKARYELASIYDPYLDSIADCLKNEKNKKILISGHTDNFGDTIFTDELSANRAKTIKDKLVQRGIEPERIYTMGLGREIAKMSEQEYANIKHNRVALIEEISSNQNDIRNLASGKYLQGLFFTIQLGAYKKVIKNNKFNKFGEVLICNSTDGFFRYSINVYQDYETAFEDFKKLKQFGLFQDAFVTAYFLGERITLKEAQTLLKEKGAGILEK